MESYPVRPKMLKLLKELVKPSPVPVALPHNELKLLQAFEPTSATLLETLLTPDDIELMSVVSLVISDACCTAVELIFTT